MKKALLTLFISTLIFSSCNQTTTEKRADPNQEFDVVILNGRVMDPETNFDGIRNVGVKGGKIAIITESEINGKETIDASGHVVAPGFIDTHYHATDVFATKMALRDGVTTGMDLEAGSFNVKAWYDEKAKTGWQVNYGTTASLLFNRMAVHDPDAELSGPVDFSTVPTYAAKALTDGVQGWAETNSTIEEMNKVMALLDEDLRQGAIGVAVPGAYMAKGMTSYELFAAQRAGANHGRLTSVHTRYHLLSETPTEAPIAFDEVFTNAMLLDAPLLMAHNNDYGWWEIEEKLQLARDKGLNMWSEYYPYAAGSTAITAAFLSPSEWIEKRGYKYEETIYDPVDDQYLTNETYAALMKKDPGRSVVVEFPYRKAWMNHWLAIPHMTIASDAMAGVGADGNLLPWDADWTEYRGHPRTSGSHGAAFRMAREQGVPLMFTISQASYWPAKHLGDTGLEAMKERGRIQVGKIADITIFDPLSITDNSSFKVGEHGTPTSGIPYVIVNGVIVVKNNEILPVKPGQEIRFPVEARGRFTPINQEKWLSEHTIGLNPELTEIHLEDDSGAGKVLDKKD
ncbi:amidohydrolase family protein [Robiginitalea marina]|uniref:Amidohydrolase family protein n=1 Tax=Robiginitalea marina TaxID=2954105 RepID=A0ABT1AVT4_9FLAO|nr:amidohydrolase family protein [Robiginitalea marina]MCO5724116.1 amidohydrolase family protein [Robiginitalea marina]